MLKGLIEVAVKAVGAGKAKGDLDAMGKSAQNVGKSHNAARDAAEAHYAVQAKGVIGTANSTKSFSKLASTMGEGGGIVGAYATLAANVFAVTAAFNALKGAAQVEQITRGLEVLGNRGGQTLGIVATQLRDITAGAISTEQALRSTAQISSAGFKSDSVLRIGKLASDVSLALGRDMTDSMDRLTRGIIKLEPELLDELGLMTRLGEASSAYALQLGKPVSALTTLEKRQGFMNAIMAEGELKFGGVSDAAGNLKNYDKLAATFADLTKTVFGFINAIGGLSIAGFFANNMAVLGGAAILFLSTLKNQLLPGILSITATATKATSEAREAALKENSDISKAHVSLGSNPAFLKPLADAGFENAGPQLYAKAVNEAKKAILEEEAAEKAVQGTTKKAIAQRAEHAQKVRDYKEALAEVYQSQIANAALSKAENAQAAVTAASNLSITGTVRGISASMAAYRAELQLTHIAAGRLGTANTFLAVSMHGVKVAAQAAGAAMLSAMSWIGIAFAVIGGAIAIFKALQSEEKKLESKKAKELAEVYGQLGDKLKELEKINKSAASAYAVTISALTLESNAVIELAAKYQELQDAKDKNGGPSARTTTGGRANSVARWWDPAIDLAVNGTRPRGLMMAAESIQSNRTQVRRGSAALNMSDDAGVVQGLDSLSQLSPERFEAIRLAWAGMSKEMQSKEVNKSLQAIAAEAQRVSEVIASFPATNKAASDSFIALIKSATPTTAFDAPLKSLSTFINDYVKLLALEGASEEQKSALIGGIESGLSAQLSLKTQAYIQDVQTVANLEQQVLSGKALNQTQYEALSLAQQRIAVSDVGREGVLRELMLLQQKTAEAQAEIVIAKSRNALLSARISEQKTANSVTLEGLQKEMDMQNEIVANEVRMLEIEKQKLSAQLATNEAKIAQMRADLAKFDLETESLTLAKAMTDELHKQELAVANMIQAQADFQAIANPTEYKSYAQELFDRNEARRPAITLSPEAQRQIEEDYSKMIEARTASRAAAKLGIDAAVAENRTLLLGIEALNSQISATQLKALDAIKQATALQERALQINRGRETQEREIARSYRLQVSLQQRSNNILNNRSALETNLASIREASVEELETIRAQIKKEREDIVLARNKGADTDDARIRDANTAHWNIEEGILDRREQSALAVHAAQLQLNQLQAVYFDSQIKGVEMQQNVVSMLEKQASVQAEMNVSAQTLAQSEERLARRRSGYGAETREGRRASEISVALDSLKIADREYDLKLLQIDMEYDLLDARTKLLREETRVHLTNARAANTDGILNTQIAQLEAVVNGLGGVLDNSAQTRASARATAGNIRENARVNLETVLIPEGNRNATGYDRNRLRGVQASAEQYLGNRIEAQTTEYVRGTAAVVNLTAAIEDLRRNPELVTVNPEPGQRVSTSRSISRNASNEALALGRELNSRRGFRADEHSQLGGVSPVHARGSLHDSDRALDINYSGAGEKAKLDELAVELRRRYGDSVRILWQTTGHWTHLHIEFLRDTYTSMVDTMENAVVNTQERAAEAVTAVETAAMAEIETPTGLVQTLTNGPSTNLTPTASYGIKPTMVQEAVKTGPVAPIGIAEALQDLPGHLSPLMAMFGELGPEGQAITNAIAGIQLVGDSLTEVQRLMAEDPKNKTAVFSAMADTAVAGLGVLRSALEATSQAKIASIDREIAAEQKRDGKSAESVAKLAALEKKKDATARKAFEVNKKLQIAQAIISTASAVMQTYANSGGAPWAIPLAAMVGAVGAAQIAMIAGTSYQGGAASTAAVSTPSTLSIGKRGDSVDLAKNNPNAGGEIGYLRGARGRGSSSANYSLIGSAYGGAMPRGYGNTAFVVGEHGPETITPETPITVRPTNDNADGQRALPPVNINIQALDAKGVEEILYGQRGNLITMLREAANNSGQTFLENINTAVYNKPNVGRL